MSSSVFALQVSPSIPPSLKRLDDLATNFWFSWNPSLGQLFRKLDPVLWRKVEGSPRLFLRSVDQSILDRAATDQSFIDEYRRILAAFDDYLGSAPAFRDGLEQGDLIAYFCAEYGWHESFPIYSGGLGVLAGDHCKTASDLNLPFVAVGLLYRHGYFHQRIDRSGQQVPDYPPIDPRSAPLSTALNPDGSEVRVTCPGLERTVAVRVWKAPVGRVTVLLLDTDVPENVAEDRLITGTLYGGSNRKPCSASAAFARCVRSASSPRYGTSTRAMPRSCSSSGCASTRRRACRSQPLSKRPPPTRSSRRIRP